MDLLSSQSRRHGVECFFLVTLQVLTALAAAQGLGFRHWDLCLKNIMEHRGDSPCQRAACLQSCVQTAVACVLCALKSSHQLLPLHFAEASSYGV